MVEERNKFKGLDLIDLKNYGQRFMTLYRRQWSRPSPRKKKKGKTVIWKGLTKTVKRREAKDKGEKEQVPIWMQSSKQ